MGRLTVRPRAAAGLLVAAALAAGAGGLAGQATSAAGPPVEPAEPDWIARWSPLAPLADLPRSLPGGAAFPSLLTLPGPRVGQFWRAGNPGALPLELDDSRGDIRAEWVDVSGAYRRPLDPGAEERGRLSGLAWGPVSDAGAAVGRVVVDRARLEDGAHSNVLDPYGSNPFVVFDTLGDPVTRTAARLEGAGGWRVGAVGLGLGLAFEAQETRTRESPVPRHTRTASPAVTVGVAYRRAGSELGVGAYGRWQRRAHSINVISQTAPSRVYAPDGYAEPVPFDVFNTILNRRLERTAWAAGLSAAGRLGGLRWTAYAQREALAEDRFNPGSNDPVTDRWEAEGWTAGGALQLPALAGRVLATVDARATFLDGEGHRGDVDATVFRAEERRLELAGDVRLLPGGPWEAGLRAGIVRENRTRRDALAETRSEVESWAPAGAVEVVRHLGDGFAVSVGGAASQYAPTALTPDPAAIGPGYARWIAPALDVAATEAAAWSATSTLRLSVSAETDVWLRVRRASAAPGDGSATLPASAARDGWDLSAGVVLGGR